VSNVSLYFAITANVQVKQIMLRREWQHEHDYKFGKGGEPLLFHELKAAIVLFSSLNEKQKGHYAGLESLKLGDGGDPLIADLGGINCHTVAKGRKEILAHDLEVERVGRKGGGRNSVKKTPEIKKIPEKLLNSEPYWELKSVERRLG